MTERFSKLLFYKWQGLSHHGLLISGTLSTFNVMQAKHQLEKQGITLTQFKRQWQLKKPIKNREISVFLRQLATLITAGIPLLQSIEALQETQPNSEMQALIKLIQIDILTGKTLSFSFQSMIFYFGTLTHHLIDIGEKTGTLPDMLNRIALLKEKNLNFKNKLKQALIYPSIIALVALLISFIMLFFVVPRFAIVFNAMHSQLPAMTRGVIALSHNIKQYYWTILFPFFIALFFRKKCLVYLFYTPFIKTLMHKIVLSQFTYSLATSLNAGIPLLEALKITSTVTALPSFKQNIQNLQLKISQGQPLHLALPEWHLFPNLLIQMVKTGEESGMLDKMLFKIAEMCESEVDHFITQIGHLLEPLIMIVLGVLIGGLVVSMYLPIFKLGAVI